MSVLIIDYGMGNLGSVRRSLEECGGEAFISRDPSDLERAAHVILPGVGAFPDGMRCLREQGWIEPLKRTVLDEEVPLLGICLGMQLLASVGTEGEQCDGLGLIPGRVERMTGCAGGERIPHVGWNEVYAEGGSPLLDGVEDGTDFYFVHSFRFLPDEVEHIIATTPYCGEVVSAVAHGTVFGTQFHPEKSSRAGFRILENFLALTG
ncbi:MAG: imidazole glycerol phosphate synthase subunit HisH [Magnetococcales bacterium]|nr:imidazole glycerol phosphate synthase subunit HisH [Magnetococcales bacterium]